MKMGQKRCIDVFNWHVRISIRPLEGNILPRGYEGIVLVLSNVVQYGRDKFVILSYAKENDV
jgi:hypothetical protein